MTLFVDRFEEIDEVKKEQVQHLSLLIYYRSIEVDALTSVICMCIFFSVVTGEREWGPLPAIINKSRDRWYPTGPVECVDSVSKANPFHHELLNVASSGHELLPGNL